MKTCGFAEHTHFVYEVCYLDLIFFDFLFLLLFDSLELIFGIRLFHSHKSFPDVVKELFFTTLGCKLIIRHHIGVSLNLYGKEFEFLFVTLNSLRKIHQASVGIV